ncbi:MAG: ATP-binding protein [Pseudomonadota bacterium]
MIEYLKLKNVGPSVEMQAAFAPRLNVITGDNGLGKSFLLDVAWWALTRTWADNPALPTNGRNPTIEYRVLGKTRRADPVKSTFRRADATWPIDPRRPPMPGIVIYVRIDGGFSVWDPARNYWRKDPGRPPAYHFDAKSVWEGLEVGGERPCEGLERDWVGWQEGQKPQFQVLKKVLEILSPAGEPLRPGPPKRLLIGEGRDRPTLLIGNDQVPVALASAGIRRVLALTYLLVWAWHEHRVSAELLKKPAEHRVVVLFDEPETHLHPRWQRTLIPSLLSALVELRKDSRTDPQIILATHAPLVVASLEPYFSTETDDLFLLRNESGTIRLTSGHWAKQGDATNWLVSEAFGLEQARSLEAEQAIEAAEAYMRGDELPEGLKTREAIHARLRQLLPGHDTFWPRWIVKSGSHPDGRPRRKQGKRS